MENHGARERTGRGRSLPRRLAWPAAGWPRGRPVGAYRFKASPPYLLKGGAHQGGQEETTATIGHRRTIQYSERPGVPSGPVPDLPHVHRKRPRPHPGKAQRDSRRHPATSPRTRNVAHGFGAPVGGWACCPTGTRWSQQERRHQILPGSLWAEAACGQRGPRALEPGSPQQGPAWRRSALRGVPSPAVTRLPRPTAVLTRPPADPAPLQEGQGRCRCRLVPSALIAQPAWLASPPF